MANKITNMIKQLFSIGGRKQEQIHISGSMFGSTLPSSGKYVSQRQMYGISIYMGIVDQIANDFSLIDFTFNDRKSKNGLVSLTEKPNSSLNYLLQRSPTTQMNIQQFKKLFVKNIIHLGAFAAYIYRRAGVVLEIVPINPSIITPAKDENGKIFYKVSSPNTGDIILKYEDVIYVSYDDFSGGYTDVDFRNVHQSLLSELLGINELDSDIINNSYAFIGALESPNTLTPDQRIELRDSFKAMVEGAKEGSGILVLDPKWEYKELKGKDIRSQITDDFRKNIIRKLSVALHVPLAKLGYEDNTFKNIADLNLVYLKDALQPYAESFIAELNHKIVGVDLKHEFSYKTYKLLKMNLKDLAVISSTLINSGSWTPNEVRVDLYNREAKDEGEALMANSAIRPLAKIDELVNSEISLNNSKAESTQSKEKSDENDL